LGGGGGCVFLRGMGATLLMLLMMMVGRGI
jgi:hypothetical protein